MKWGSPVHDQILEIEGIDEAKIVIAETYFDKKAVALIDARGITAVRDGFTAEFATEILRGLKEIIREVEDSRKIVKAPILDLGRQIDGKAKTFVKDLTEETNRLSRLIGAWQAAEREKQAKARCEALEKERQAREEALRKAQAAGTPDEEQMAVVEGANAVQAARQAVAATKAAEPQGTRLLKFKKFEVLDIQELFRSRPECVRLEPNGDVIRALIKKTDSIPGVRIWEEVKTVVSR